MKNLLAIILTVFIAFNAQAQSPTVKTFSENAEGYNLYLYQSMIRMLNKDHNPDFNMLIRNLDHMRFITTSSGSNAETAKQVFKELDDGYLSEGFEPIMSIDNKDYICHVYETETKDSKSHWVATMFGEGMAGVLEMQGFLDLKYLDAMSSLNMERLGQMLPIDIDDFDESDDIEEE
jgi:hypothetical protein